MGVWKCAAQLRGDFLQLFGLPQFLQTDHIRIGIGNVVHNCVEPLSEILCLRDEGRIERYKRYLRRPLVGVRFAITTAQHELKTRGPQNQFATRVACESYWCLCRPGWIHAQLHTKKPLSVQPFAAFPDDYTENTLDQTSVKRQLRLCVATFARRVDRNANT